jgi:hypothetical protein
MEEDGGGGLGAESGENGFHVMYLGRVREVDLGFGGKYMVVFDQSALGLRSHTYHVWDDAEDEEETGGGEEGTVLLDVKGDVIWGGVHPG